jgi:hypothetical protein
MRSFLTKWSFLLLVLSLAGSGLYGQNSFFTPIKTTSGLPDPVPAFANVTKKVIYRLDETSMRAYLLPAPLEFTNSTNHSD